MTYKYFAFISYRHTDIMATKQALFARNMAIMAA